MMKINPPGVGMAAETVAWRASTTYIRASLQGHIIWGIACRRLATERAVCVNLTLKNSRLGRDAVPALG